MAEISSLKTVNGQILDNRIPEDFYFPRIKGGRHEAIRGLQNTGNPLSGFVVD